MGLSGIVAPGRSSDDIVINADCRLPTPETQILDICTPTTYPKINSSLYNGDLDWKLQKDGLNMTCNVTTFITESATTCNQFDVAVAYSDSGQSGLDDSSNFQAVMLFGKTFDSDARVNLTAGTKLYGCDDVHANNECCCRGYGAAACRMQPCVRQYNDTIRAGQVKESLVSTSGSISWGAARTNLRLFAP
jgi:hypothetical protein